MKDVIAFKIREDEIDIFNKYGRIHGFDIKLNDFNLTPENVDLCREYDSVIVQSSCTVNEEVIRKLSEYGCRNLITRAIGYNNIDIEACVHYGLNVANVSYSPASVAEFTMMLILMALRKMKRSVHRMKDNQPSIAGLRGRELHELCVGIVGYGNIGKAVIGYLKGFGCRIIVNDYKPEKKFDAEYATLEQIYEQADIISLHIPLKPNTYHLVNENSLKKMKDGVILINTSRGGLIDTGDLIEYLHNGKVGACALDTFEEEARVFSEFRKKVPNALGELNEMDNVILTPHLAFFTETATDDCIRLAFDNIIGFDRGEEVSYSLLKKIPIQGQ